MIFVIITCSILYIILYSLLYYLYIEYKQDYKELEERLLQLEKRLPLEVNEEDLEYLKKYDNEYRNWLFNPFEHGMNITSESFSKPKKKENNTQESGEYDMPCGRKKGRGGKRK